MASLAEPTDAGPEGFGSEGEDPGERRARYSRGKRRRRLQAIWFFVIVLAYMVFRMVLDGS